MLIKKMYRAMCETNDHPAREDETKIRRGEKTQFAHNSLHCLYTESFTRKVYYRKAVWAGTSK